MFSIVIPLYNKESLIKKSLEAVLAQTFKDFEIVIVNDGSTDNSVNVVKENFSDSRIRIISQINAGVSAARNKGIEEANGEYIAFLDADDEWKPNYLATQYSLIQKYPDASVFATNYEFKDEKGIITPTILRKLPFKEEDGILSNYFQVASCSHPPLWTSAIVAKKTSLQEIGGFPAGVASGEDLLTWAKLAVKNKIAFTIVPSVEYFMPSTGTYRIDPRDMSLKNDKVRPELIKIFKENKPPFSYLYLSFWDKMRAVINLKKLERRYAFQYAVRSVKEFPLNLKAYILLILSIAPGNIIHKLLK